MIIKDKTKLEEKCSPVSVKEGEEIGVRLLHELRESENGIGLAANQIGINKRVCVINIPTSNNKEPIILINPEIIEKSEEKFAFIEGCLSFPGLFFAVERAYGIQTEFQNKEGVKLSGSFVDLPSKCFQHEYDHMLGKLYTEYAGDLKLKNARKKQILWQRKNERSRTQ